MEKLKKFFAHAVAFAISLVVCWLLLKYGQHLHSVGADMSNDETLLNDGEGRMLRVFGNLLFWGSILTAVLTILNIIEDLIKAVRNYRERTLVNKTQLPRGEIMRVRVLNIPAELDLNMTMICFQLDKPVLCNDTQARPLEIEIDGGTEEDVAFLRTGGLELEVIQL